MISGTTNIMIGAEIMGMKAQCNPYAESPKGFAGVFET